MYDTFTDMTIICQNSIFTKFCTWHREMSLCARAEPGPPHLSELGLAAPVQKFQDTLTKAQRELVKSNKEQVMRVSSYNL